MKIVATYRNFAIVAAIVTASFYVTITTLLDQWLKFDESQSHGLIIVALFVYLFTLQLKQLPPITPNLNWLGITTLTASSIAWLTAASLNIETIEQLLLIPIIITLCWSLLGVHAAAKLTPSIFLLIFAIPIWDYLTPALVDISSYIVMVLIEHSSITALIDGNSIYLPHGRIDIADGCSGLRYFTVATALAYYLIITSEARLIVKIKLLGLAILLGLVANWLRIYFIIMIAHFTEMQSSLVEDHELFGWVLFFIVCLPLLSLARKLPPVRAPDSNTNQGQALRAKKTLSLSILALVSGPILYHLITTAISAPRIGNWQQLGYQLSESNRKGPLQLPESNINLKKQNGAITQNIAIHWRKDKESDLVPYIENSINRKYWTLLGSSELKTSNKQPVQINLHSRKELTQFTCTIHWYSVGGMETTSYYLAKLLQIPAMIGQNRTFAAAVITTPSQTSNCEPHLKQLLDIANQTHGDIIELTRPPD